MPQQRRTHNLINCAPIAYEYAHNSDDMPTIVIHDNHVQENRLDSRRCLLKLSINDQESGPDAITNEQAAILAAFAINCIRANAPFVICCPGGVGRSIAAWCAIVHMTAENPDADMEVWESRSYTPNHRIFEKVCQALAQSVNADRDDPAIYAERYDVNRTTWMTQVTYSTEE